MDGAYFNYAKWNKSEKDKVNKMDEGDQKVQTFSYKISARDLRYSTAIVTSLQYCTVYLKIL